VKSEISWGHAVKKCAARVDVSRARCVARFRHVGSMARERFVSDRQGTDVTSVRIGGTRGSPCCPSYRTPGHSEVRRVLAPLKEVNRDKMKEIYD
jgi:hypothetical protein